jgi:hypothetical protein
LNAHFAQVMRVVCCKGLVTWQMIVMRPIVPHSLQAAASCSKWKDAKQAVSRAHVLAQKAIVEAWDAAAEAVFFGILVLQLQASWHLHHEVCRMRSSSLVHASSTQHLLQRVADTYHKPPVLTAIVDDNALFRVAMLNSVSLQVG